MKNVLFPSLVTILICFASYDVKAAQLDNRLIICSAPIDTVANDDDPNNEISAPFIYAPQTYDFDQVSERMKGINFFSEKTNIDNLTKEEFIYAQIQLIKKIDPISDYKYIQVIEALYDANLSDQVPAFLNYILKESKDSIYCQINSAYLWGNYALKGMLVDSIYYPQGSYKTFYLIRGGKEGMQVTAKKRHFIEAVNRLLALLPKEEGDIEELNINFKSHKFIIHPRTEEETNIEYKNKIFAAAKANPAMQRLYIYERLANLIYNNKSFFELQQLSDLKEIPLLEKEYANNSNNDYITINGDGEMITFDTPETWNDAKNDGERFKYCLKEIGKIYPKFKDELWCQFLATYYFEPLGNNDEALEQVADNLTDDDIFMKTINNKTIKVKPDTEYNLILNLKNNLSYHGVRLGILYATRHNYKLAKEYFMNKKKYSNHKHVISPPYISKFYLDRINNETQKITSVPTITQEGKLRFDLKYINAKSLDFTIYKVNLLDYFESQKAKFFTLSKEKPSDENRYAIYDLFNYKQYLKLLFTQTDSLLKVNEFNVHLSPRKHYELSHSVEKDSELTAGYYLLMAKNAQGDTTIRTFSINPICVSVYQKDTLNDYLIVTNAITGTPIQDAKIHLFQNKNFHEEFNIQKDSQYKVNYNEVTATTDSQGVVIYQFSRSSNNLNGYITLPNGDYAIISEKHYYRYNNNDYDQKKIMKIFPITNQPIYRPGQTVKMSAIIRSVSYVDTPSIASSIPINLKIRNSKGQNISDSVINTNQSGIINYEYTLPKNASLGNYYISLSGREIYTTIDFSVEEYRKPEFEVIITTPDSSLSFGDVAHLKIEGKYYTGLPVNEGDLNVKITKRPDNEYVRPFEHWTFLYDIGYCYSLPYHPFFYRPEEIVIDSALKLNEKGILFLDIPTQSDSEGNNKYNYYITAQLTDPTNRMESKKTSYSVADNKFNLFTILDAQYGVVNKTIQASFNALDILGNPLAIQGIVTLFKQEYQADTIIKTQVCNWDILTDSSGNCKLSFSVPQSGYYQLEYEALHEGKTNKTSSNFTILGTQKSEKPVISSPLKLSINKQEYAVGEKVGLMIESTYKNAKVYLAIGISNQKSAPPQMITLDGYSKEIFFEVRPEYQPNFFIQANTNFNNEKHSITKEIFVPPANKELIVKLNSIDTNFTPNECINLTLETSFNDSVIQADCIVAVYDHSLEAISDGSNINNILSSFWNMKNNYSYFNKINCLNFDYSSYNEWEYFYPNYNKDSLDFEITLEAFLKFISYNDPLWLREGHFQRTTPSQKYVFAYANGARMKNEMIMDKMAMPQMGIINQGSNINQPIRSHFSDAPYWSTQIKTDSQGVAKFNFKAPENLGRFIIRAWAVTDSTQVGSANTCIQVNKEVMIMPNTPRFMVTGDTVCVHVSFIAKDKNDLQLKNLDFKAISNQKTIKMLSTEVTSSGADVVFQANEAGIAKVEFYLSTKNAKGDAISLQFPVLEHGIEKQITQTITLLPSDLKGDIILNIPKERKSETTEIVIQYTPSIAFSLIGALPYLISYPHGCTEQGLNRFVPCAILNKTFHEMNISLDSINEKRALKNPRDICKIIEFDDQNNPIYSSNPIYSKQLVEEMTQLGIDRLNIQQNKNGSWGWFPGMNNGANYITALVVDGLLSLNDPRSSVILEYGLNYLKNEQKKTFFNLNLPDTHLEKKHIPSHLDVKIYTILTKIQKQDTALDPYIWENIQSLSIDGLSQLALAYHMQNKPDSVKKLKTLIESYLEYNSSTQTAYLRLPINRFFWFWYEDDIETHAHYLDLLIATEPFSKKTAYLAKFLIENRKQSGAWRSTRATSAAILSLANYLKVVTPKTINMNVKIYFDEKEIQNTTINNDNLFDNTYTITLDSTRISTGKHSISFEKNQSQAPLFVHAYARFVSTQNLITAEGHEIKVTRRYFKIQESKQNRITQDNQGKAKSIEQNVTQRIPLGKDATLSCGDLIEVELIIQCDNDYEFLHFKDPKPAVCETLNVKSGYRYLGSLSTYQELRDDAVHFFVPRLTQGRHTLNYRLRVEKEGQVSALPTQIELMYTPEIRSNSDENKLNISPKPFKL